jgi:hypothetical protein
MPTLTHVSYWCQFVRVLTQIDMTQSSCVAWPGPIVALMAIKDLTGAQAAPPPRLEPAM